MCFERPQRSGVDAETVEVGVNGTDRRSRDVFPQHVKAKEIVAREHEERRCSDAVAWRHTSGSLADIIEVVSASTGVDGSMPHELSHPLMTVPAPRTAMRTI